MCVKDGCSQDVCERWGVTKLRVKDGVWQSCVWKMACDKVACVCVEHLNRCKTSIQYQTCRGAQKAHRAVPNEALYGVLRISRLITWTYLHFSNFPFHGNRLSLQPDTRFQLRVRLPQSALWIYSTGLSFSPFQNAELWMHYSNLGFISPFLFTSWTSRGVRRRGLFII